MFKVVCVCVCVWGGGGLKTKSSRCQADVCSRRNRSYDFTANRESCPLHRDDGDDSENFLLTPNSVNTSIGPEAKHKQLQPVFDGTVWNYLQFWISFSWSRPQMVVIKVSMSVRHCPAFVCCSLRLERVCEPGRGGKKKKEEEPAAKTASPDSRQWRR